MAARDLPSPGGPFGRAAAWCAAAAAPAPARSAGCPPARPSS